MDNITRETYFNNMIALNASSAGKLHKIGVLLNRTRIELFSKNKSLRNDYKNFFRKTFLKKTAPAFKKNCEFDKNFLKIRNLASEYIETIREENKEKPSVIFFGYPDFRTSGGGQRSWQMAKSFFRQGYHIEYYHEGTLEKSDLNAPAHITLPLSYTTIETLFKNIPKNATIIFEAPSYKYKDILCKAKENNLYTVYEHIDNWESSLGNGFFEPELFSKYLEDCDCIVATCKGLIELISKYTDRPVLYSPNAVDNHLYRNDIDYACPEDLVRGRKTLLYFGALTGEWHNWDIVKSTALECPDCAFNLIGRGIPDTFATDKPDNIHFLGAKKQSDLPAYLAHSDFAMIPFDTGEISKYVSPLKIFEYLALQTPVLATPLDDIIGYPNTIISNNYQDWADAINSDYKTEDTTIFTENNCWDARCKQLIEYKEKYLSNR